ncbi:MAG: hypothetical protein R2739_07450 [Chitinophagales bacterium]|nr:hypothetical protein [Bacteroidota bacterium]
MKYILHLLFLCLPFFVSAQKGFILQDVNQNKEKNKPSNNNTSIWKIESFLVDCNKQQKCFSVLENGKTKLVPQSDIIDFNYVNGTEYTVQVEKKMKTIPVNAYEDIYNYSVTKIITKKVLQEAALSIPVAAETDTSIQTTTDSLTNLATIDNEQKIYYTQPPQPISVSSLNDDINSLKLQLIELKKQIEVLRLQQQLQLQLINSKK